MEASKQIHVAEKDQHVAVNTLQQLLARNMVPVKDSGFASSLCEQYGKKGSLSPKQWYWVDTLIRRGMGLHEVHETAASYTLKGAAGIWNLFDAAHQHQKKPGLLFSLANGRTYKLYIRGDGKLSMFDKHIFPGGWRLAFGTDGHVDFWKKISNDERNILIGLLVQLAADPLGTLTELGKYSNHCCCCGKQLTDPVSVELGVGPTCAKNWGLA